MMQVWSIVTHETKSTSTHYAYMDQ